jgi:hypothetical protein
MKSIILSSLIGLVALFTVSSATAQSPKLRGPLTATDLGDKLEVCFDISGLGNVSETQLTVTFDATVTTQCRNRGGNIAPGQTQTISGADETFTVPVSNGRATGCVQTTQTFEPGSCPPGFAGGEVTDVSFSNVRVTVAGRTFRVSSVQ